jgi:hypothetical protein
MMILCTSWCIIGYAEGYDQQTSARNGPHTGEHDSCILLTHDSRHGIDTTFPGDHYYRIAATNALRSVS